MGTQMNTTTLEKDILQKMLKHGYIGNRHTSIDNIPKGFPKHLRGNVKKALKKLNKKGYLKVKPTSYGLEISLNPETIKEIIKIIQE